MRPHGQGFRACVLVALLVAAFGATAAGTSGASGDRPGDAHRALPVDLEPSLRDAAHIRPRAYTDGCHARSGDDRAVACAYGVEGATRSVLLFGDSHALQWLPTLEAIAAREGWRVYSLTKSACPVPRVAVIVRGERLRDCTRWRRAALDVIDDLHPDLVIAASLGRIYRIPGAGTARRRARLWHDGWVSSLRALAARSDSVVLLGDTPMWREDAVACLGRHRHDIGRCDTPISDAISRRVAATERDAAADAGVTFVPTADLVCPDDRCRAVQGGYLVLLDDQHMTVAWARLVADRLLARLPCSVLPGNVTTGSATASPSPAAPAGASPASSASPPPVSAASPPPVSAASPPPVSAASPPVPTPAPSADAPITCPRWPPTPGIPSCACS